MDAASLIVWFRARCIELDGIRILRSFSGRRLLCRKKFCNLTDGIVHLRGMVVVIEVAAAAFLGDLFFSL